MQNGSIHLAIVIIGRVDSHGLHIPQLINNAKHALFGNLYQVYALLGIFYILPQRANHHPHLLRDGIFRRSIPSSVYLHAAGYFL